MPIEIFVYDKRITVLDERNIRSISDINKAILSLRNVILSTIKTHPLTCNLYQKLDLYCARQLEQRKEYQILGEINLCIVDSIGWPIHSLGQVSINDKLRVAPLYKDTPLLPVTLCYSAISIELPAQISTASTIKELRDFLVENPKIGAEIIQEAQKYPLNRRLLKSNSSGAEKDRKIQHDSIKFAFLHPQSNFIMKENYEDLLRSYANYCYAQQRIALISDNYPELLMLPPHKNWFDSNKVDLYAVCGAYLGSFPGEGTETGILYTGSQTVSEFCKIFQHHQDSLNLNNYEDIIEEIATAIAYYCIDTNQTEVLNKHPAIAKYSLVPIEGNTIYDRELSTVIASRAVSELDPRLDTIADKIHEGQSPSQSFSVLRSKTHDTMLTKIECKIRHSHQKGREVGSQTLSNLLIASLNEEVQSRKVNLKGRTFTTIAKAMSLAKNLPQNIRLTQYHYSMFFLGTSSKESVTTALEPLGIIRDLRNIIFGYLGGNTSYLRSCYAIPAAMLNKITKTSSDLEFNNPVIIKSCEAIFQELNIDPEIAQGIIVEPDYIGDKRSLTEQFQDKKLYAKYIYFALPIVVEGSRVHNVAVVIDTQNKQIYVVDSESNQRECLDQALMKLKEVIKKNSCYPDYLILHPPVGKLKQQNNSDLCGVYVVSNIVGLITQLENVDISPKSLGIQPSKLLKNSQIDLETWSQLKPIEVNIWKSLIILTTLNTIEIERCFVSQLVENHQKAQEHSMLKA
jgi:hypothetical protein